MVSIVIIENNSLIRKVFEIIFLYMFLFLVNVIILIFEFIINVKEFNNKIKLIL